MRAVRFVTAGVLVAGLVVMAEAQPGGRARGGAGTGPAQLVANEAVQKDLKLSDEQIEKIKTWAKDYQAKQTEDRKSRNKDATPEERATKAAEGRAAAYKELAGVLKPVQVDRLKQIERQAGGVAAFADADTLDALKLTDAQKGKVKSITDEYQKDARDLGGFGGGGGNKGGGNKGGGFDKEKMAENQAKRDKLTKSAMADIEAALTDDQKKTWKDLTGEPFDRSKLTPGGFGNRGKAKAKD